VHCALYQPPLAARTMFLYVRLEIGSSVRVFFDGKQRALPRAAGQIVQLQIQVSSYRRSSSINV
jgi:hypothetical protein